MIHVPTGKGGAERGRRGGGRRGGIQMPKVGIMKVRRWMVLGTFFMPPRHPMSSCHEAGEEEEEEEERV